MVLDKGKVSMVKAKTRIARYILMTAVLGLVIYLALGYGARSFEAYCPFGGAESLWGLFVDGEFSCALGPLNLSLMLGLIGLVIVSKKSFCGWACPIGFLGELSGRLGGLFWKKRPRVPRRANGYLKLARYVVLIVSLYFTYKLGELVLRGYDPFYLIFSGFGHGSVGVISSRSWVSSSSAPSSSRCFSAATSARSGRSSILSPGWG